MQKIWKTVFNSLNDLLLRNIEREFLCYRCEWNFFFPFSGSIKVKTSIIFCFPFFSTNFLQFIITHIKASDISVNVFDILQILLKRNWYDLLIFFSFLGDENKIWINTKQLYLYSVFLIDMDLLLFSFNLTYLQKLQPHPLTLFNFFLQYSSMYCSIDMGNSRIFLFSVFFIKN